MTGWRFPRTVGYLVCMTRYDDCASCSVCCADTCTMNPPAAGGALRPAGATGGSPVSPLRAPSAIGPGAAAFGVPAGAAFLAGGTAAGVGMTVV